MKTRREELFKKIARKEFEVLNNKFERNRNRIGKIREVKRELIELKNRGIVEREMPVLEKKINDKINQCKRIKI